MRKRKKYKTLRKGLALALVLALCLNSVPVFAGQSVSGNNDVYYADNRTEGNGGDVSPPSGNSEGSPQTAQDTGGEHDSSGSDPGERDSQSQGDGGDEDRNDGDGSDGEGGGEESGQLDGDQNDQDDQDGEDADSGSKDGQNGDDGQDSDNDQDGDGADGDQEPQEGENPGGDGNSPDGDDDDSDETDEGGQEDGDDDEDDLGDQDDEELEPEVPEEPSPGTALVFDYTHLTEALADESIEEIQFKTDSLVLEDTIYIDRDLKITGDGTILYLGNGVTRHFRIDSAEHVTLIGLSFIGGDGTGYGDISDGESGGFSKGSGTGYGGIGIFNSKVTIENCYFEGNGDPEVSGGAIYAADNSDVEIYLSQFRNNQALEGGAVTAINSSLFMRAVDADGNYAQTGGALYLSGRASQSVTLEDVKLNSNRAARTGGAIYVSGGLSLSISGNGRAKAQLKENSAVIHGGAIYVEPESDVLLDLAKVRLTSNSAGLGDGGAVYMDQLERFTANEVVFGQNTAVKDFIWDEEEELEEELMADWLLHQQQITNSQYTEPYINAYNNYDVKYPRGSRSEPELMDLMAALPTVGTFAELEAAIKDPEISLITINAPITFEKTLEIGRNVTIVGSGSGQTLTSTSGRHFSIENFNVNISNLTFFGNETGGGISAGGSLTLSDVIFDKNASSDGGALYVVGTASISGTKFTNNKATGDGGALYVVGNTSISSSEFTNNRATVGGAIYAGRELSIGSGTIISGNSSTGNGGGIAVAGSGALNVAGSGIKITGNTATGNGGGIYLGKAVETRAAAATLKSGITALAGSDYSHSISSAEITGNTGASGGGIHISSSAVVTIGGATVNNNTGFGIFIDPAAAEGALVTIDSGTVNGNSLGGIYSGRNINIRGTTVNQNGSNGHGITIDGPAVAAIASAAVAENNTGILIGSGADVTVTGSNIINNRNGIDNEGDLYVEGNTQIRGSALVNLINDGDAEVSGGSVLQSGSEGIFNSGDLYLYQVEVKGNEGGGIYNEGDLIVEEGSIEGNRGVDDGGGLFNAFGATAELSDLSVTGNYASESGGGIHNSGSLSLSEVIISQNEARKTASGAGGGIYNSGDISFHLSEITNNQAQDGGGIYNTASSLTIESVELIDNAATRDGGAIYNTGSSLTVDGIEITGEDSGNSAGRNGGAIYNTGSSLTVTDSAIEDNWATGDGGGIYNTAAGASISAAITGNQATSNGGAIYNTGTITSLKGTIEENEAASGGGLYNNGGTVTVTDQAAISENEALAKGGGIYNAVNSTITILGAVNENSASSDGGGIYNSGTLTVEGAAVTENTVTDSGSGAGIYNDASGILLLKTATVTGNEITNGTGDGGGIYNGNVMTVTGKLIVTGNSTNGGDGGGIYTEEALSLPAGITLDSNAAGNGGGIYTTGNLTIDGASTISENNAAGYGGGIYAAAPDVKITADGLTMSSNSADEGGAIYAVLNYTGEIDLEETSITGNLSSTGAVHVEAEASNAGTLGVSIEGGSYTENSRFLYIINEGSSGLISLTVDGVSIAQNEAESGPGGAIYLEGPVAADIATSAGITENSADSGGFLYVKDNDQEITISSAAISKNEAGEGNGGAIYIDGMDDGSIEISATAISSNKAYSSGGALYVGGESTGEISIAPETVKSNEAGSGGVIAVEADTEVEITVTGGTFEDNVATAGSGGCVIINDAASVFRAVGVAFITNSAAVSGGAIYTVKQDMSNVYVSGRFSGNLAAWAYNGPLTAELETVHQSHIDVTSYSRLRLDDGTFENMTRAYNNYDINHSKSSGEGVYYPVFFHKNYSGEEPGSISDVWLHVDVPYLQTVARPSSEPDPEDKDHFFDDWNSARAGGETYKFYMPITGVTRIYAGWEEIKNPVKSYNSDSSVKEGTAVNEGSYIIYNINWKNYSDVDNATLTVTDPLEQELTFLSSMGTSAGRSFNPANNTVSWEISGVEKGQEGFVTVYVQVNEKAAAKNVVVNTAQVQVYDPVEDKIVYNRASNTLRNNVITEPYKTIESGYENKILRIGDTFDYTVHYYNHVAGGGNTIKITEIQDKGLILTPPQGLTNVQKENQTDGTVKITGEVTNAPEGWGTLVFKAEVTKDAYQTVCNIAYVTVGGQVDVPTNVIENPVQPFKSVYSIKGDKSLAYAEIGQTILYEIDYYNYLDEKAGVTITDVIQKGLKFLWAEDGFGNRLEAENSQTSGGEIQYAGTMVTWNLSDVEARTGGVVRLACEVTEDADTTVKNKATVKVGTNQASDTNETETNIVTKPEKTVDESSAAGRGGSLVGVGDQITYKITYFNHLSEKANIRITDKLDDGVKFISAKKPDGTALTGFTATDREIIWSIDDVEPGTGGSVTITVEVTENAYIVVENSAEVKIGNNVTLETDPVENPVEPRKELVDVNPEDSSHTDFSRVEVGDVLKYEITYFNYSENTATVTITDQLEDYFNFIKATGKDGVEGTGYTHNEETNTVTWVISDVPGRTGGKLTVTVEVNSLAEVTVNNEIHVHIKDDHDEEWDEDSNPSITPVKPFKRLSKIEAGRLEKPLQGEECIDAPVSVGDVLTYQISYYNYTNDKADITITDQIQEYFDLIKSWNQAGTEGGTYTARTLQWVISGVEPGEGGFITVQVKVNEEAAKLAVKEVKNQAKVKVGASGAAEDTNEVINPVGPSKTPDAAASSGVQVGDSITYTISFYNRHNVPVDVTITDVLKSYFDFVSAEGPDGQLLENPYEEDSRTVSWKVEQVGAKEKIQVKLTVKVNEKAAAEGQVENSAGINVKGPDVDYDINTNTDEIPVKPSKVIEEGYPGYNGAAVEPGETVTYKIYYYNTSEDPVKVTVKDVMDSKVEFVSAVATVGSSQVPLDREANDSGDGDNIYKWIVDDAPSGLGWITVTVKVKADAAGKITNKASVAFDSQSSVDTNEVINPIKPMKVVDDSSEQGKDGTPVAVGKEITYAISYLNTTAGEAKITIKDKLDDGVDFVKASNSLNGAPSQPLDKSQVYDSQSHTFTYEITTPNANDYGIILLTVRVNSDAFDKVTNIATVKVGDEVEVETVPVINPLMPYKMVITESGADGSVVKVGEVFEYEIYYQNKLSKAATVTITDKLDDGLTFVSSGNPSGGDKGQYDSESRTVTWVIKGVEAGVSDHVTLYVRVNDEAGRYVRNKASINLKTEDGSEEDDEDTNTTINPVEPGEDPEPGKPEKHVDITSPAGQRGELVQIGDEMIYKISFELDEDTETPVKVVITDKLDPGLTFKDASEGGTYDQESHTVTWTLVDVEEGGSVLLTVTVNEKAVNTVTNKAAVEIEGEEDSETNEVENPVGPGKQVDESSLAGKDGKPVNVGDLITYKISYYNHTEEQIELTIKDTLKDYFDFVSTSHNYEVDGRIYTWKTTLDPGEGIEILVTVKINSKALDNDNDQIKNEATIIENDKPGYETNTVTNEVGEEPDNKKSVDENSDAGKDGAAVAVGDEITYRIEYVNDSEEEATVTITDRLSNGVDFVSATGAYRYNPASHTVTWILQKVEGESGGAVTLTVKVNEKAVSYVDNAASVQIDDGEVNQTNTVRNPLKLYKAVISEIGRNGAEVSVGEEITYEIQYHNHTDALAEITITDLLDKGLDFVKASDGGAIDPASSGTVVWKLTGVQPGVEGKVTLTVKVNETAAFTVENTANVKVDGDEGADTNTVVNPVIHKTVEKLEPADQDPQDGESADSDADGDGDSEPKTTDATSSAVKVGDTLIYTIRYSNQDEENAAAIRIYDKLDKGLTFEEASHGGAYNKADHSVSWSFTAEPGTWGEVTLKVTVNKDAVSKIGNEASIQIDDHDPKVTNKVENDLDPDDPQTPKPPVKTIDEDSEAGRDDQGNPDLVSVGDRITYNITYYNHLEEEGEITITDRLDKGVDFISAWINSSEEDEKIEEEDFDISYNEANHTVTWTIRNVTQGGSGTVGLEVEVNQAAVSKVENSVVTQIGNNDYDSNTVVNPLDPEDPDNPKPPVKEVAEDSAAGGKDLYGETRPVAVGDEITYDISYYNHIAVDEDGEEVTSDIIIKDTLDKGVDFVSAGWSEDGSALLTETQVEAGTYRYQDADGKIEILYNSASHTVTWRIKGLEFEENGKVHLTVRVNSSAVTEVENQAVAIIGGNEYDSNTVVNPLDPSDPGTPKPPVKETKEIESGSGDGSRLQENKVSVGDTVTYRITYYNHESDKADITITDRLDPSVKLVSAKWLGTENDPQNLELIGADGPVVFNSDRSAIISYNSISHTVEWSLKDQAEQEEGYLELVVEVTDKAVKEIGNKVAVQIGDNAYDSNTVVIPLDEDDDDNPKEPKKELDPESDAAENDYVKVGDRLKYTIEYYNHLKEDADVIVTDRIPDGTLFVGAYVKGFEDDSLLAEDFEAEGSRASGEGWEIVYNEAARTVTWTVKDVAYTESGLVGLIVEVGSDAEETIENKATVTIGENTYDSNTVKNPVDPDDDKTPKKPEKKVKPGTKGEGGDYVSIGDKITYQISYYNHLKDDAVITVKDKLSDDMDFEAARWIHHGITYQLTKADVESGKSQESWQIGETSLSISYNKATRTATWVLDEVDSATGGLVELDITVNEKAFKEIKNKASVSVGDHEYESNPAVNPLDPGDEENPKPPVKEVEEGSSGADGGYVKVGDEIEYTIRYYNHVRTDEEGNPVTSDITITDRIPEGTDLVKAYIKGVDGAVLLSGSGSTEIFGDNWRITYNRAVGTVTWILKDLDFKEEGLVGLVVKVNGDAEETIENKASVAIGDNTYESNTVINPLDPDDDKTPRDPKKEVDQKSAKGQGGSAVKVGDEITYRIDYYNHEESPADIIITDILDRGVDFVEARWTLAGGASGSGDHVLKAENAASGQNTDASIRYTSNIHTVVWTLEDIPAHTAGYVELLVKVNSSAVKEVANTAYAQVGDHGVRSSNTVRNPLDPDDEETPKIPEKTVAEGSKGQEGDFVTVGDEITYDITYYNHIRYDEDGLDGALSTITITDKLDQGVDFVTASIVDAEGAVHRLENGKVSYRNAEKGVAITYNTNSHTVTWTLEELAYKAAGSAQVTVKVNDSAYDDVTNTASVKVGDGVDTDSNTLKNPVDPGDDRTPRDPRKKVAEDSAAGKDNSYVKVGDVITYEISYYNHLKETADIIITDTLDKGFDFVEASHGGEIAPGTRDVKWVLRNVESGYEGSVTLTVKVTANALEKVENTACAKVGSLDARPSNTVENPLDPDDGSTAEKPEKEVSEDSEAGQGGEFIKVGDKILYEIKWYNHEKDGATVRIEDRLDPGVTFLWAKSGDVLLEPDGSETEDTVTTEEGKPVVIRFDKTANTVVWELSELKHKDRGTVYLEVQVNGNAVTKVENTASVKVGDNDVIHSNTVENPLDPDEPTNPVKPVKEVSKDSASGRFGSSVKVGDQITYEISYYNHEEDPALVTITDRLDPGVKFVKAAWGSDEQPPVVSYSETDHTVTFSKEVNGTKGGGNAGTVTVTVEVTPYAGETIANTAKVKINGHDEVDTNTVTHDVDDEDPGRARDPEKSVSVDSKAGFGGAAVKTGDEITYEIKIYNHLNTDAGVTVRDQLDQGVEFVEAFYESTVDLSSFYQEDEHALIWQSDKVKPGWSTIVLTVKVTGDAYGEVTNQANIQFADQEERPTDKVVNPLDEDDVNTAQKPRKEVSEKSKAGYDSSYVNVGDEITYRIWYYNHDEEDVDVRITDVLDPGLDYASSSPTGTSYKTLNEDGESVWAVTWAVEKAPAGKWGYVELTVKVNELTRYKIVNNAAVTVGSHDPRATNDVELFVEEAEGYKVIFHRNDGSSPDIHRTQTVKEGGKASKPVNPTRSGYTFVDWYEEAECVNLYDFDTIVTGDIHLYAKWRENGGTGPGPGPGGGGDGKLKVVYHSQFVSSTVTDGGKESGDTVTVKEGDIFTISAGYEFIGWSDEEHDPDKARDNRSVIYLPKDTFPMPNRDVHLYAVYEEADFLLNTDDHYAYVVGYPDGTVRPDDLITREEVTTIFFRLLTDEARDDFWKQTNNFSDVAYGWWSNNAVSTMANGGIVSGYPDGTFRPQANITRAEVAVIAAQFDYSTYSGADKFSDIRGHWAQDHINRAANRGWVSGYTDTLGGTSGTFKPDDYITRAEMMTLVNQVLGRNPRTAADLLDDMVKWPDNASTTAWYYLHVQEATNSHYYEKDEAGVYEKWTELRPVRDWAALEQRR